MEPHLERLSNLTAQQKHSMLVADGARWLLASAGNNPLAAARVYLQKWSNTITAPMLRAAISNGDLIEKVTGTADLTPPAFLQPLATLLERSTVLEQLQLVKAPLITPIPYGSADGAISWVKQGAPKPVSNAVLDTVMIDKAKCAGILVLTAELARLAGGAELALTNLLVRSSVAFIDTAFLDPAAAAVADTNPASITNGLTPVTPGTTVVESLQALVAAFSAARPQASRPAFIMSPVTALQIPADQFTADGKLRTAAVVTTVGAGGNIILVDADGIYYNDQLTDISTSEQAVLPGATLPISLWQNNLMGVKVDRFISWAKEPTAAQYVVVS